MGESAENACRESGGEGARRSGLTRRDALAIAGSALATPALAAVDASQPPSVMLDHGVLAIGIGDAQWRLSKSAFSPSSAAQAVSLELQEITSGRDTHFVATLSQAVLPGTTIPVSLRFVVGLNAPSQYWFIRADLNGVSSQEIPLLDWLAKDGQGLRFFAAQGRHPIHDGHLGADFLRIRAASHVRLTPGMDGKDIRLAVVQQATTPVASLTFRTPSGLEYQCELQDLTFEPLSTENGPVLRTSSEVCRLPDVHLEGGLLGGDTHLILQGSADDDGTHPKLMIHSKDHNHGSAAIRVATVTLSFEETSLFFRSSRLNLRMRVADFSISGRSVERFGPTDMGRTLTINGRLDRQLIETKSMAFLVQPTECGKKDIKHTITSGQRTLSLDIGLLKAYVPVSGASLAEVDYFGRPFSVTFGQPSGTSDGPPSLFLGASEHFVAPLDHAALALKRTSDLFDLRFEFRQYGIECIDGKASFWRQEMKGCDRPVIVAVFPPQHVQEEAGNKDGEETRLPARPVKTQLSGPTRIAMQTEPNDGSGRVAKALTIEEIMDWRDLALAVHDRALPADAPIDAQLRAVGLQKVTPRSVAKSLWWNAMTTFPASPCNGCNDGRLLTQIEPVTGLIVSPDKSAVFHATPKPGDAFRNPLWRLGFVSGSVRVVHSRGTGLPFIVGKAPEPYPTITPFTTIPTQSHRDQLLVLTSGFGLPSLRRLQKAGGEFKDDPHGSVVLPEHPDDFAFLSKCTVDYDLNEHERIAVKQEGLYIPKPFSTFEMSLTSLKGSLNAIWTGEPPAPIAPGDCDTEPFYNTAVDVQGYWHRIAYGRDAFVEVKQKGFLVPFGFRASIVSVAERKTPAATAELSGSDPVAYLILTQRETSQPRKVFPALNQPYDSRRFSASSILLNTVTTPPLALMDKLEQRVDGVDGEVWNGRVFWPRTKPGKKEVINKGITKLYGHEVVFEWQINDSGPTVKSPLLFVSNAAAHDPSTVKKIVDYYNSLPDELVDLRTAIHGGVVRQYALSRQGGETSFETDKWILGVEGRAGTEDSAKYTMDALMEGADQPPLYPTMETADICMQSLDRMLGAPQGVITTRFSPRYVEHAFDTSGNPAEIFLEVLKPSIDLDLTGKGGSAGGLAQPNSRLAAVSRKTGMVGGRPKSTRNDGNALRAAGGKEPLCDFSAAESGRFDPMEFLGGGPNEAKLLGIVPLKEVVRAALVAAAPQLKELEAFSEDVLSAFQANASKLIDKLREVRASGNMAIEAALALAPTPVGSPDQLQRNYPEIARRYDDVLVIIEKIEKSAGRVPPDQTIVGEVGKLVAAIKALVAAAEATASNPLPEGIKNIATAFKKLWDTLEGLRDPVTAQAELKRLVIDTMYQPLLSQIKSCPELVRELFGAADIDQILANPAEAIGLVPHGALTEAFAKPFVNALEPVRRLCGEAVGLLAWSPSALHREAVSAICGGHPITIARVLHPSDVTNASVAAINNAVHLLVSFKTTGVSVKEQIEKLLKNASYKIDQATEEARAIVWSPPTRAVVEQALSDFYRNVIALFAGDCNTLDIECNALVHDVSEAGTKPTTEMEQLALRATMLRGRVRTLCEEVGSVISFLGVSRSTRTAPAEGLDGVRQMLAEVEEDLEVVAHGRPTDLPDRVSAVVRKKIDDEISKALTRMLEGAQKSASCAVEDAVSRVLTTAKGLIAVYGTLLDLCGVAESLAANSGEAKEWLKTRFANDVITRVRTAVTGLADKVRAIDITVVVDGADYSVTARLRARVADLQRSVTRLDLAAQNLVEDYGQVMSSVEGAKSLLDSATALFRDQRIAVDEVEAVLQAFLGVRDVLSAQMPLVQASALDEAWKNARDVASGLLATVTVHPGNLSQDALYKKWKETLEATRGSAVDSVKALGDRLAPIVSQTVTEACSQLRGVVCGSEEAYLGGVCTIDDRFKNARSQAISAATNYLCPDDPRTSPHPLAELTTFIEQLRDGVDFVKQAVSGQLNEACVPMLAPMLASLTEARKLLEKDREALSNVIAACGVPNTIRDKLNVVRKNWQSGPDTVKAARIVSRLGESLLKGQIGAFVDFGPLRAMLIESLTDLVPTSFSQQFEWGTAIEDYPRADPVFVIDRDSAMEDLRPQYKKVVEGRETIARCDLLLTAHVNVNLRTRQRDAVAKGQLGPFKIRLLGSKYDLVTIGFKGASFEASPENGTKCKVEVGAVTIGKQLEFLQTLEELFSPKGDGVFVTMSLSPPGVEAGYRYCMPVIQLGAMVLENIAVSTSMLLPFDQSPALFRFSFASRENPFFISMAPYGGGGFVGVLATVKGVVGFQAQFEYGASVPTDYGPLKGKGRVTAGIYLRTRGDNWAIAGLVQAVGSGDIACFSITFTMVITVCQENGGDLTGSATFEFEFDAGIGSVSYSVTVTQRIHGGSSAPLRIKGRKQLLQGGLSTHTRFSQWGAYRAHLALQ